MATIQKQLTLKESLGTKVPGILATAPVATYTATEISTLLAGTSPVPEGIRFHFEKASGDITVGLIAVSLGVVSVPSASGGTEIHNLELTSATKKYLRRGSSTADLTAQEYLTQFPGQQVKAVSRDGITNACVFFSRTDLREILNQEGIGRIAFFPATIERTFTALPETYATLVAVGLNSAGTAQGVQIRSELPCPPHCGDDYPPE